MAGFPPVFSLGKASEEGVSNFEAGSTSINSVVAANFPIGTHVWTASLSDDVYSKVEYRGQVTQTNSTYVNVTRPAVEEIDDATARIWKATSQCVASYAQSDPVRSRRDLGVDRNRALDGTIYSTQVRDPLETVQLAFRPRATGDLGNWWSFVEDAISDGVDQFTLSWYDYRAAAARVCVVALMDMDTVHEAQAYGWANWTVECAIQTEGAYL